MLGGGEGDSEDIGKKVWLCRELMEIVAVPSGGGGGQGVCKVSGLILWAGGDGDRQTDRQTYIIHSPFGNCRNPPSTLSSHGIAREHSVKTT